MKTKKCINNHNHGLNIGVVMASAALALASSLSFAQADLLPYVTGFEDPPFVLGLVDGQDGWATFDGPSAISETKPESGSQSIEILGDFLEGSGWLLLSTNRQKFDYYDGYALGTPVVEIVVDAQLEGEQTGDLVSANLIPFIWNCCYQGSSMLLSSNGDVQAHVYDPESRYVPIAQYALGQYQRLGIRTDFETRMSQFFVNGDLLAKYPIGYWVPTDVFFGGVFLEMAAINDPGVIDPSGYKAYFDNLSINAYAPVPLDIKPSSCPNPLNVKSRGVLPVAILGTEMLDVSEIDPASIRLVTAQGGEGISPLRWSTEDVAGPYEPYIGKEGAYDCNESGPDGYMDLTVKFDSREIAAQLGAVDGRTDKLFTVYGELKEEFDGTPIIGEDFVRIK
jgi:hypothetical protein